MEVKNILFIAVFFISMALFALSARRLIKFALIAQKENRFNNIWLRIKNVVKIALAQSKILRDPIAGPIHVFIFWGFISFLAAVLESIIQGFYPSFSLSVLGGFHVVILYTQEVFGVLILIGVISSILRRLVFKIPRLQFDRHGQKDAVIILSLISLVVFSMYGLSAYSFILESAHDSNIEAPFITKYLSAELIKWNLASVETMYEAFWWAHILLIFGFLNYLPFTKHLHVLTSIPNVFLAKVGERKYQINPLDLEDENAETFGASDVEHLTWKNILDGYTCTECGRCHSVCPAANTGKALSPRKIIIDIRERVMAKAPFVVKGITEKEGIFDKSLIRDYISEEEVWACTTCNSCVYECPVSIEHIDPIIELRRNLVLSESKFPPELAFVFKNLETNFSPWAFNPHDRANWAEDMNIKTLSEDANGEILFWVGCAGSYDARYINVTKAFAKIMQKAGVDFRILGVEEKCVGDAARRLGNEYLAQTLMRENIETLNGYGVKKIVTACPHCFNFLKHEYKQFGGNYEVIHHTEFIRNLIKENRIELKSEKINFKTTYHDSCYLGRYNDIYDEPRNILKKTGADLIEMKRQGDKGFCCGAGGGRMFLEETEGVRINEERTKEALETNADVIASACPFCMTMFEDGLKNLNKNENVRVKDAAEIVYENIK